MTDEEERIDWMTRSQLEDEVKDLRSFVVVVKAGLEEALRANFDLIVSRSRLQTECEQLREEIRRNERDVEDARRTLKAGGIVVPGWTCACGAFNGAAKEILLNCRRCEGPNPLLFSAAPDA